MRLLFSCFGFDVLPFSCLDVGCLFGCFTPFEVVVVVVAVLLWKRVQHKQVFLFCNVTCIMYNRKRIVFRQMEDGKLREIE